MILKSFDLNKSNETKRNFILFYGINNGAKEEEILKIIKKNKALTTIKFDEKEILNNIEAFYENIYSKSLFEENRIIIINRATDKITRVMETIISKNVSEIIILNSDNLEKKSKLRVLFEKNKETICVAFYPDNDGILSQTVREFLKQNNISVSNENISLIVNKCNGDRGILKNELNKIKFYSVKKKNISSEEIFKIINLIENHSISELIDNCLIRNKKRTVNILNENNYTNNDYIEIIRLFSYKLKKLLILTKEFEKNSNINTTIASAKPPIFWKEREIVKRQIIELSTNKIKKLLFKLNEIELISKKNIEISLRMISDFILEQSSKKNINN